jgi:hypothetical protein
MTAFVSGYFSACLQLSENISPLNEDYQNKCAARRSSDDDTECAILCRRVEITLRTIVGELQRAACDQTICPILTDDISNTRGYLHEGIYYHLIERC